MATPAGPAAAPASDSEGVLQDEGGHDNLRLDKIEEGGGLQDQMKTKVAVDMDSHIGLRGMAAMWIVVYHCILFSGVHFDFQGSSLMPLFFMLSGFTMAAVYGLQPWQCSPDHAASTTAVVVVNGQDVATSDLKLFAWGRFYVHRVARSLPVYYLCTAVSLPLWFLGFGFVQPTAAAILPSIIVSFIPINTLLCFAVGGPLDPPSWTVCTLLFFWLLTPLLLPRAQRMTDEQLSRRIARYYYLQLVVLVLLFGLSMPFGGLVGFSAATMNPVSRLPLFIMGLDAGLLCLRHAKGGEGGPPLPWPRSTARFLPWTCCTTTTTTTTTPAWSRVADRQTLVLVAMMLVVTAADTAVRVVSGGAGSIMGSLWLQAIVPFSQLELIVALTRDGATSWSSRLFRTKVIAWLGTISMTVYLVHFPVLVYLLLIKHGGPLTWPSSQDCKVYADGSQDRNQCEVVTAAFNKATSLPLWAIVVVPLVTVAVSAVVFYGFEEPIRRAIKGGGGRKKTADK